MDVPRKARRADAERNREAIVEAGLRLLAAEPRASMADIATAAGVTRVTMYGHFASRADLVREIFTRAMADARALLTEIDLTGPAIEALERLVRASWRIVGPGRNLLVAARTELGDDGVRAHHADSADRLGELVRRGRSDGVIRTDVPTRWLIACWQNVLHGAADELRAGRLSERTADRIVWATIHSIFTPPPRGDLS